MLKVSSTYSQSFESFLLSWPESVACLIVGLSVGALIRKYDTLKTISILVILGYIIFYVIDFTLLSVSPHLYQQVKLEIGYLTLYLIS